MAKANSKFNFTNPSDKSDGKRRRITVHFSEPVEEQTVNWLQPHGFKIKITFD